MKKLLASVSATLVVLTSVLPTVSFGASIPTEYVDAYQFMYDNGLTSTKSAEGFMPFSSLTREALARFAVNFYTNVLKKTDKVAGMDCSFSDEAQVDSTLKAFVMDACAYGLMKGSAGKFMPKGTVTRGQIITVISRMLDGSKYDTTDADFYRDHAENLKSKNIITTVNASANVLRGDASLMFKRASSTESTDDLSSILNGLLNGTGTTTTGTTTAPVEVKAGNLNVAISPSTAPARSVPGVGTVPAGSFKLSAGSSDITVRSIVVTRKGLGNRTDINRVYFELNGVRVSGRQTVGFDEKAILAISPALVVKANSSVDLDLIAVMSGSGNGEHFFAIEGMSDVEASAASVVGTWPVATNKMSTTNYPVAGATFDRISSPTTAKAGDKNAEIGAFSILGSDANKDQMFKSITLRNDGTGEPSKSLSNVVLKRNGVVVSSGVTFNGKYITVALNDVIKGGVTANYYLQADINTVENVSGDSYNFRLQYLEDLNIVESNTLFKAAVSYGSQATNGALNSYSVQGGDLILARPTDLLANQTVSAGQQDVELFRSAMTVRQGVRLGDLTVNFDNTMSQALSTYFQNFKLMIGGRTVSTYTPATNATGFVFQGTFDVSSSSEMKIVATVRSNVTTTTGFRISSIDANSFAIKEYISNGNVLASFIGSVQGINVTVGSVQATFTKNDGLAATQIVRGSANKDVFGIRIQAGEVSDLNFTRFVFVNQGGTGMENLVSLQLLRNGAVIDSANLVANNASGSVTFNNFGTLKVAKNTSETILVKATFSTSVLTGKTFVLNLSTGGIQGTDQNGNSLTNVLNFAPVASSVFTIRDAGTLNLLSNGNVNTKALLGPSADANTMSFDISAQDDDIRLTDVYVSLTGANVIDNNRISKVSLMSGSTELIVGSVFASGFRFNLTDSSTEVVSQGKTKTYTVKVMLNSPSSSGSYAATGLMLTLGTGGIPASEVRVGTANNGIRAVSVNAGSTVVVNNAATVSPQHTVASVAFVVAPVGTNNGFNGSTTAYKFKITPSTSNSQLRLNSIVLSCIGGTPPTVHLMNGDVNTFNDVANQLNAAAVASAGTITVDAGKLSLATFSSEKIFTIASTAAWAAGSKNCVVTDVNVSEVFSDGSVRVIGSTNGFGNVGFNNMTTASLQ